jgi:hypothetical protein
MLEIPREAAGPSSNAGPKGMYKGIRAGDNEGFRGFLPPAIQSNRLTPYFWGWIPGRRIADFTLSKPDIFCAGKITTNQI